ncbi:GMC family oxidoreductase [Mycobacterium sp. OAE908]|uniref:GMC oxidoreductase n=1 Tax=Mycobacterium sp. OAE908 TaxID=2817899 RepID=UPI001AE7486B
MIISGNDIEQGAHLHAQLVVIGAGPAGIVSALEASRKGIEVIVVETGNRRRRRVYQRLSKARRPQPDLHAPVEFTVSRGIGGTTSIWGGRCVPYDAVDFVQRDLTRDARWPVSYRDAVAFLDRACEWMQCGRPVFDVRDIEHLPRHLVPGLEDGDVLTSTLERWSLPTNFGKVYFSDLRDTPGLRVVTDTTCVRINLNDDQSRATGVECRTLSGGSFTIGGDDIIVATGGLESTRLLMCSPGPAGKSIGDHSGHLGHWYMAHLEGVVADLVLTTPADQTIYYYEHDVDGSYVRRRFTFDHDYLIQHELPNISGWIANPELADASHRNAWLSLTYLVLHSPLGSLVAPPAQRLPLTGRRVPGTPYGMASRSSVWAHIRNLAREPVATIWFGLGFGLKRLFSSGRRPPGFFVLNRNNRYPFQYHAEHLPQYDSCVRLSDNVDELGMPRLEIDIRWTDKDIDGVIAAHRHWDKYLRANGVGRLEYLADDLHAAVRERTGGGFHQVGTTRMSKDPDDGVVDENLAVHGIPNLHVVASSVFPTSGQANSTLMVVVFAIRLIEHLYGATSGLNSMPRSASNSCPGRTFADSTSPSSESDRNGN